VYALATAALILLLVGGAMLLFLPEEGTAPADISPAPTPTLAPQITTPLTPPVTVAAEPPAQAAPTTMALAPPALPDLEQGPPPDDELPRLGCTQEYTAWLASRGRECDLVAGAVVPPISGPLLSGGVFDLRDWGGRPTVVLTWVASYGPGNRRAISDLQVLYDKWGDQVDVIAISEDAASVTRQAVADAGVTLPVVTCFADQPQESGTNLLCGPNEEEFLWVWWGNQDLPSWVVLDADGRFVDIRWGASTTLEEIDALVAPLLREPVVLAELDSVQVQTSVAGDAVVIAAVSGESTAPQVAVPDDGLPVIAYIADGILNVAKCLDPGCSEAILTAVAPIKDQNFLSLVVGPAGHPVVGYGEWSRDVFTISLLICADPGCVESDAIPIGSGTGHPPLLALDAAAAPVVVHENREVEALAMVLCGDRQCENLTRASLSGVGAGAFVLREDGRPLIAGIDHDDRESPRLVFHSCDDPGCTSVSTHETSIPATGSEPGLGFDMTLAASGSPVVVFEQGPTLHYAACVDNDCADQESIANVLIASGGSGGDAGLSASVVIDGDGLPVITFVSEGPAGRTLYVARCDDISCTGEVEIQSFAGCVMPFPGVAVDRSGSPLVVYQMNPWERDGSIRLLNIDVATANGAGSTPTDCD
jgi:hypothetical protein